MTDANDDHTPEPHVDAGVPPPVPEPHDRVEALEATEAIDSSEFVVKARTQRQLVMRRFFHHRLAMASLIVLIGIALLAWVGLPLWKYPYDKSGTLVGRGEPTLDLLPSFIDGDGFAIGEHPFGQDNIGRDYFAVTLRGAQRSLLIATVAGVVATLIGTIVGALSGFYRGMVDSVLMRIVDVLLTVPLLLVAAVLGYNWGGDNVLILALIIVFAAWYSTARIIRAEFMSLREKEYVEAARALGASNRRIMFRHIMPNAIGSIIVACTLLISSSILVETALSYLGLGVKGSDWSLGKQVSTYQTAFNTRPWLFWYPGIFIVLIALCINFIGDGLRGRFDPKQTRVRQ